MFKLNRLAKLCCLSLALLTLSGCIWIPGRRMHFPIHVHGMGCGHLFKGGIWVDLPGIHIHGIGCGHSWRNGAWVSVGIP